MKVYRLEPGEKTIQTAPGLSALSARYWPLGEKGATAPPPRGILLICPHRENRTKVSGNDGRVLRRFRRRHTVERSLSCSTTAAG